MMAHDRLCRVARIDRTDDEHPVLHLETAATGGACGAGGACPGCRMAVPSQARHALARASGLAPGSIAELSVSAAGLTRAAIMLFGVPLAALIAGAWMGAVLWGEAASAAGGLTACIASMMVLRLFAAPLERLPDLHWEPVRIARSSAVHRPAARSAFPMHTIDGNQ